jgi:pimeloyl-ACP methyl ester carboxylesterase
MPELATAHARIGYEQTGQGPDIVWVSGGGDVGATWREWQVPAFPGYRHTTFDNRGAGETQCSQPTPWTIADFARDTAELIEALCQPPVIVAGLSMGGGIVLQLAIDRPDLVRCAIPMGAACNVPMHVFAFGEDLQAPAAYGRQIVDIAGNAIQHELEGLGHCSLYGHAQDVVNAELQRVLDQYV